MAEAGASQPMAATADKPATPNEFLVSSAPHLAAGRTTRGIMLDVIIGLAPLFIASIIYFRGLAVITVIATTAGCLAAEAVANWMRGRTQSSLTDGSAVVTGLILAFSLPPSLNPYMAFIGGVVAITLAKAVFGGLGHNLFNPAMVGRAFLMLCFPAAMGAWTEPITLNQVGDPDVDGVTMATPLNAAGVNVKAETDAEKMELPETKKLFLGKVSGCVGETSALAALIGGIFLLIRGTADYRPVAGVLAGAFVFSTVAHLAAPDVYAAPMFHLTSGALMFGAFFIATDYVGAPITPAGRWIFGLGVGVLVMVIRLFGAYPEGVMFAILVMNALTPLIERWTRPTPFGGHVPTS